MTQTSGRSCSSVAQTVSSSVSARISTVVRPAESRRAERDLRGGLLAGDEQRARVRAGDRAERREEQRRLADARLTADEDERARNEAAAEHAVELRDARRDARGLFGADVAEREGFAATAPRAPSRDPCSSSTRVPNAPQPGHFPSQRPDVVPHSPHVNWTVTFATRSFSLGTRSDAIRSRK